MDMARDEKLGEILLKENLITPKQLQEAIKEAKEKNIRIGEALTNLGILKDNELLQFLAKTYKVPSVNLEKIKLDPEVVRIIPLDVARRHKLIAIKRSGPNLMVAMADPTNLSAIDEINFLTGYNTEPVVALEHQIMKAIEEYYGVKEDQVPSGQMDFQEIFALDEGGVEVIEEKESEESTEELLRAAEDKPVVKFVNKLIHDAIRLKASDIHIEPYEKEFRIRFRIDGILQEVVKPPLKMKDAIISRVKIMSKMQLDEKRRPQDGRIKMRVGNNDIDMRVSCLPTVFGEKIVIRILDKSNLQLDMTKLGFEEDQLKHFKEAISKPYGMVLITGPTGSGKTTTLYSALAELNKVEVNISTAEDPVEYNLPGINQVHIREEVGLSFAAALRAFLRQDPDIIMVGEIRDYETAEIAIKAALTGHLVLSTLHTNDAPSTVTRLLNMGIEPFLLTASLNLVGAQRLCRKICPYCKEEEKVSPKVLLELGMTPDEIEGLKVYRGRGCDKCNGGYKGRIAVYEIMPMYEELKEMILNNASAGELKRAAIALGMKTLRRSALNKLKEGIIDIREVVRVTAAD
jgi:type IV pilus assembly protein PilB